MEIAIGVIIVVVIAAGMLGIVVLTFSIFEDIQRAKAIKKFEEDLGAAIENSRPSWVQLKSFTGTYGFAPPVLARALANLEREVLLDRSKVLADRADLLRTYIEQSNSDEPFEGIPTEIRIHLERLRERDPSAISYLEPLATQIRLLVAVNSRDRRRQRIIAAAGLIVGIIGLVVSVIPWITKSL